MFDPSTKMSPALEEDGLRGPVKTVRIETVRFSRQLGEAGEGRRFVHATTYDTDGRRMETVTFNPDGSQVKRRFSERAEHSGAKCVEVVVLDAEEAVLGTTRSAYDAAGRLIEQQSYRADGSLITTLAPRYTARGEKIEAIAAPQGTEGGVLYGMHVEGSRMYVTAPAARWRKTSYGSHGKPMRVLFLGSNSGALVRVRFDYDEALRLVREVHDTRGFGWEPCDPPRDSRCGHDSLGTALASVVLFAMTTWTYARRGRFRDVVGAFGGWIPSAEIANVYDRAGRRVEEVHYVFGRLMQRVTFQHDAEGRQVEAVSHGPEPELVSRCRFSREFDGHGNWTKETLSTAVGRFAFFTPESVTERTITYY